tara:strand:+ start:298 stop:441 length:144 start_codon:yes stop_codon:yes gene_type:complete
VKLDKKPITKNQLAQEKKKFTTAEIWNCKVPHDFKGRNFDYILYQRS